MKKKIIFSVVLVALLTFLLAICISAVNPVFDYDEARTAKLDNGKTVSLYDENGNALSYYNNGTEIVSMLTTDMFKWNDSGWLEMKDSSVVSADKVVIMNLQDPTLDATAFSNFGLNISFRHSTNLEYVFFSNMIKKFNGTYYFSNCDKLKVFEFTTDSLFESPAQYTFYDCAVLGALYFPSNVTQIPTSNSGSIGYASCCPMLSSVTFASDIQLTKIGATAFYGDTSLVSIDLPSTLTEIESNAFYGCTSLRDVMIPDGVTTIGGSAFRSTAIVNSPFTANSQCTTWGAFVFRDCDSLKNIIIPLSLGPVPQDKSYGPFSDCDGIEKATFGTYGTMTTLPAFLFSKANVEEIILPEGIVHIGEQAFNENKTIKKIVFPNSVQTAGQRVLQSCSSLETVVFGESFKYFINTGTDHGSFTYGANSIKNVYLPASFYAEAPETAYRVSYMFSGGGNVKFFYVGTMEQMEAARETFKTSTTNATDNNGNFLNATLVNKKDYEENKSNYENGDYIICGYTSCELFYDGVHGESTTTYKFKDELYTSKYCSYTGCARCNSTIEKEEADALFTNKGYSTNTIDGVGITYTIVFNPTAIEKYEELAKTTFEYGLIAATTNVVKNGVLFDETGKAVDENSIVTGFRGTDYTIYNLKITSIPEQAQETGIYACAYIIDTNSAGVKTINYVGNAVATEAETVTYQAILQKESTNS